MLTPEVLLERHPASGVSLKELIKKQCEQHDVSVWLLLYKEVSATCGTCTGLKGAV